MTVDSNPPMHAVQIPLFPCILLKVLFLHLYLLSYIILLLCFLPAWSSLTSSHHTFCITIQHLSLTSTAQYPREDSLGQPNRRAQGVLPGNWLGTSFPFHSVRRAVWHFKHNVTKFNYIMVYVNIPAVLAQWMKRCLFPSFLCTLRNYTVQLHFFMSWYDMQPAMPGHRPDTHMS